jgi:RNA polymerase sigma-70 factor (ECF subfamily)
VTRSRQDDRITNMRVAVHANAEDLLAYFTRRVSSAEDAADLVGETMLAVWRRIADLPDDSTRARMWMFGVARRVLANHHRSQTRQRALTSKIEQQHGIEDSPYATARAEFLDVRAAIDQLPAAHRELILLVHGDGFSIVEASRIMSTTASTARSRYSAALKKLHDVLNDEHPHETQANAVLPTAYDSSRKSEAI